MARGRGGHSIPGVDQVFATRREARAYGKAHGLKGYTSREYTERVQRGAARGLSKRAAAGHAKPGERTARQLKAQPPAPPPSRHRPPRVVKIEKTTIHPEQWKAQPVDRASLLEALAQIEGPKVRIAVIGDIVCQGGVKFPPSGRKYEAVEEEEVEEEEGGEPDPNNITENWAAGGSGDWDEIRESIKELDDEADDEELGLWADFWCPIPGCYWIRLHIVTFAEGVLDDNPRS